MLYWPARSPERVSSLLLGNPARSCRVAALSNNVRRRVAWSANPWKGRRGWLLLEKLRQADAEALEDSGFDSVALGAGLCDLEHAVPEL